MGLFGSNNVVKDRAEEVKDNIQSHLPDSLTSASAGKSTAQSAGDKIASKFANTSGAEQDRYGSHFWLGADAHSRIRAATLKATSYKGEGSEQAIYGRQLSVLDQDDISRLLGKVQRKADKEVLGSGAWVGYDGRMLKYAAIQGKGAEQDRYGAHLGLDEATVKDLTDRLARGAEKVKKSLGA